MNIKKMIISIIIIMILINIIFLPKTLAISDIIEEGDNFLNSGGSEEEVVNKTKIKEVSSKIYNVLLAIGIGAAVIVGAVLGITFILSSAEGKAKVSETLVPYIIGCFVVFGAFAIWKVVVNIGNNIENTATMSPAEQAQQDLKDVNDGKTDVTKLDDKTLKYLYRAASIDSNLNENVNGARNQNKITLSEAIKKLSSGNRKIYDECKKRGLLQEDGIWVKD